MTPEELYRLAEWMRGRFPLPSPQQTPTDYTNSLAIHTLAEGIHLLADDSARHIERTTTDRGFIQFDAVPDTYGGQVRVYESSAAFVPHVWIDIKSPAKLQEVAGPPDGMTAGTVHLTLDQATQVRDQLTWLIQNHYQVKDR